MVGLYAQPPGTYPGSMYSKGTKVKISLRHKYSYDRVELVAEEQQWDKEFVFEIPQKEVLDALRIQTEYEDLQQRLQPLFEEATKIRQARYEQEKAEKERQEAEV